MDYKSKNQKLIEKYNEWTSALREKEDSLFGDDYSNPYYCAIPSAWYDTKYRVLIVGEEGHGDWGCGKWGDGDSKYLPDDIESIQTYNWSYLASNLYLDGKEQIKENELYPKAQFREFNPSRFWTRARKLNEEADVVCAWTNADKLHRKMSKFKNCALSTTERKRLHQITHKILRDEIEILDPTHVIFFGWRRASFETELPEVFEEFYKKDANGDDVYKDYIAKFQIGDRWYIFTKHPGARNLPGGYKNYEDSVIKTFKETLS